MPPTQNDEAKPLAQNRDFKVLLGSQGVFALMGAALIAVSAVVAAVRSMRRASARFVAG